MFTLTGVVKNVDGVLYIGHMPVAEMLERLEGLEVYMSVGVLEEEAEDEVNLYSDGEFKATYVKGVEIKE